MACCHSKPPFDFGSGSMSPPIDYEAFLAKLNGAPTEAPTVPEAPEPVETTSAADCAAASTNGKTALATKLEAVTDQAVDKLGEIMSLTLDSDSSQFAGVLRAQTSAANTALTAQIKVDETRLRQQSMNRFPELLRALEEVKKRLPTDTLPPIDGGENGS
jgi:hypothetical protein